MKLAVVVPTKGTSGMFAAKKVVEFVQECGDRDADVILKSDQEPSIKYLVDDIMRIRPGAKTLVELSPKGSSGSNGIVERGVQSCEGQIRCMKSQLDERYKIKVEAEHPVVVWLCSHAAYLLNFL